MSAQTIQSIQEMVARRFGVTTLDLISRRQGIAIARPRHLAMWIARYTTLCSLAEIGRAFGGRDHTTVLNAIARADQMMDGKPDISALVWTIVKAVDETGSASLRRAMMRIVA
jgi:chromosomal replication initiator protein